MCLCVFAHVSVCVYLTPSICCMRYVDPMCVQMGKLKSSTDSCDHWPTGVELTPTLCLSCNEGRSCSFRVPWTRLDSFCNSFIESLPRRGLNKTTGKGDERTWTRWLCFVCVCFCTCSFISVCVCVCVICINIYFFFCCETKSIKIVIFEFQKYCIHK